MEWVGPVVEWDRARVDDLLELCHAALPEESLTVDDLEQICFAPEISTNDRDLLQMIDAATFAVSDAGAVSVSLTGVGEHRSAHVQLLVVHPSRRRRGIGSALLAMAEGWATAHGATELTIGGAAPFYLFTGVDSRWTDAICLFERGGYERIATELDLVCPTRPGAAYGRRETSDDVAVVVVSTDEQVSALMQMVDADWPLWSAEFRRAGQAGTVVVAMDAVDGTVLGAAAHSVGRLGVIGPVAVAPSAHGRGIGSAMMAAVLSDLSVAGFTTAEIAWTSTVRFYAKACGAKVGRSSLLMRRRLVDGATPS